jgi:ribosome biogenesis GTPase
MIGTVVKVFGRYITVEYDGRRMTSVLRGRMRKDAGLERYSEAVAVGDVVEFHVENGLTGAIGKVYERSNVFGRKHKDSDLEDIIASNLGQIVVVQSFHRPRLNLRFIDRLLVRARKDSIPALLCVNKLDMAGKGDVKSLQTYYRSCGLDIVTTSAKSGEGLAGLKSRLSGKISMLVGNSGVGKSSIVNAIYPGFELRTMDISESTGKGRHATTNVEMFRMDGGAGIIDTPGLREFGLLDIRPHELGRYFMEFDGYAEGCGFRPCTHDHEPGCAVKERVKKGSISEERYKSYLNILHSLQDYYNNRYRK